MTCELQAMLGSLFNDMRNIVKLVCKVVSDKCTCRMVHYICEEFVV